MIDRPPLDRFFPAPSRPTARRESRPCAAWPWAFFLVALVPARLPAAETLAPGPGFYIGEFRVTGATHLSELEKGQALYPYLGPGRTVADIESARAALEKEYRDKGFETVAVEVPVAAPRGGVVHVRVTELTVGRVRVLGARYSLPSQILRHAPALQPGTVPNLPAVQRDLLALNQWPNRRVTPELKAGATPDTVDIDLTVEDKLPLHGSLEVNNRHSTGTTALRVNGAFSYDNLWQRGHTLGGSFQLSPQELQEVQVFSAYYLARFAPWPAFNLLLQATKQNSNVSTLGGAAVAGRGETAGLRGIFHLGSRPGFTHSATIGFDFKRFEQSLRLGGSEALATPITYFPFTAGYSAGWAGEKSQTDVNAALTFAFRGTGSEPEEFDRNRFQARGSFFYVRGDASHTQNLPGDAQLYLSVQGQASSQPLVSSEQLAGGGLGTVRGYLEAEALGDDGAFGSLELRTPSLLTWAKRKDTEWRVYGFLEGGVLRLQEPLREQQARFTLASVGVGTRLQLWEHFHGSLDVGVPFTSLTTTQAGDVMLTFRLWADF